VFNPKRLTLARERRGLTKLQLAQKVGCTARSITAYESDRTKPSDETTRALSLALRVPETFFAMDDPPRPDPLSVSFRSLSRLKSSSRDAAIAAGSFAVELSNWIEGRFDLPPVRVPDFRELNAEDAASGVRAAWGLGQKPIKNMVHLLEAWGCRVFSLAEGCHELDAFCFWDDGRPFVLLNGMKSAEKARMDAAHELAHLVMHRHEKLADRQVEAEAKRFAGCFLVPQDGLLAYGSRSATVRSVLRDKERWGASAMAYARRLSDVGLATEWQHRQLCIKLSTMGFRSDEVGSDRPRETSQLLGKVFSLLRESGQSRSRVAESIGLYKHDLDGLVFGLIPTAIEGGGETSPASGRLSLV
jgi:Zn-dependent peptidase ImmA (M78 family)/transcriptional regulator with XRE-family HTH domain